MISDYAMQPVVTMVDHSVINGITDTSTDTTILAPSGTTTREQALIMANRFCTAFKPDKTPIAAVDAPLTCRLPPVLPPLPQPLSPSAADRG